MLLYVIAAVIGVAIGVLSGMLGIGGGGIMIAIFRLGFGLSAIQSTATSLFTIIPTSISGVYQHLRNNTCLVPLGIASGLGGALTSPLGVQIASMSPGWAIMLGTGIVVVYSSSTMLRKGLAMPKTNRKLGRKTAATSVTEGMQSDAEAVPASAEVPSTKKLVVVGFAIGLVTGVLAGYVGLGGGFLMVPLFVTLLHQPMKTASGTSLLAIFILAIPGVIRQAMLGNVAFAVGLAMSVGTIPGAIFGANLTKKIPERELRIFFAIFLICVAIFLVINEFLLVE